MAQNLGEALIKIAVKFDDVGIKGQVDKFAKYFSNALNTAAQGVSSNIQLFNIGKVQADLADAKIEIETFVKDITSTIKGEDVLGQLLNVSSFQSRLDKLEEAFANYAATVKQISAKVGIDVDNIHAGTFDIGKGQADGVMEKSLKRFLGIKTTLEQINSKLMSAIDPIYQQLDAVNYLSVAYARFSKIVSDAAAAGKPVSTTEMIGNTLVRIKLSERELEIAKELVGYQNKRAAVGREQSNRQARNDVDNVPIPLPRKARRSYSNEEIDTISLSSAQAVLSTLEKGDPMISKFEKRIESLKGNMDDLSKSINPVTKATIDYFKSIENYEEKALDSSENYAKKIEAIREKERLALVKLTKQSIELEEKVAAAELPRFQKYDKKAVTERDVTKTRIDREDAFETQFQAKDSERVINEATIARLEAEQQQRKLNVFEANNLNNALILRKKIQEDLRDITQDEANDYIAYNEAIAISKTQFEAAAKAKKNEENVIKIKAAAQNLLNKARTDELDLVRKSSEFSVVNAKEEEKRLDTFIKLKRLAGEVDSNNMPILGNNFQDSGDKSAADLRQFDRDLTDAARDKLTGESADRGEAILREAKSSEILTEKLRNLSDAGDQNRATFNEVSKKSEELIRAFLELEKASDTLLEANKRRKKAEDEVNNNPNFTSSKKAELLQDIATKYDKITLAIRRENDALTDQDKINDLLESKQGKEIIEAKSRNEIISTYKEELNLISQMKVSNEEKLAFQALAHKNLEAELKTQRQLAETVKQTKDAVQGKAPDKETGFTKAYKEAQDARADATAKFDAGTPARAAALKTINDKLQEQISKLLTVKDLTEDKTTGVMSVTKMQDLVPDMKPEVVAKINKALAEMNAEISEKSAERGRAILDTTLKYADLKKAIQDINAATGFSRAEKDSAIDAKIAEATGTSKALESAAKINAKYDQKNAEIRGMKSGVDMQAALQLNGKLREEELLTLLKTREAEGQVLSLLEKQTLLRAEEEDFEKGKNGLQAKVDFDSQIQDIKSDPSTSANFKADAIAKRKKALLDILEAERAANIVREKGEAASAGKFFQESKLLDIHRKIEGELEAELLAADKVGDAAFTHFKRVELRAKYEAEITAELERQDAIAKKTGSTPNVLGGIASGGATPKEQAGAKKMVKKIQEKNRHESDLALASNLGKVRAVKQYEQAMAELSAGLRLGMISQNEFNAAQKRNAATLRQQTSGLKQFISYVVDGTAQIRQLAFTLADAGKQFVYSGLAIVGFFTPSIYMAAEFEQAIRNVTAVMDDMRGGIADVAIEALSKQFLSLGEQTEFSATAIAGAARELALAGFSFVEVQNSIESVVDLASSANIELTRAAEITANLTRAFGIAAEDSQRVVDVLSTVATSSNAEVEDLAQSYTKLAPIAASLGQSLEETATALGVLGDAGLAGSLAGTGMSRFFSELLEKEDTLREKFKTIGSDFEKIDPTKVGIREIIRELERLQKAGLLSTKDLFSDFDQRSARTIVTLVNQGVEAFDDLAESAEDAAGKAKEIRLERIDTLSGDIEKLKSTIQTFFIEFGDKLLWIARQITQSLTTVVRFFTNIVKWLDSRVFNTLAQVTVAVAALAFAFGGLTIAVSASVKVFAAFQIIKSTAIGLQLYAGIIWATTVATGALTTTTTAATGSLAAWTAATTGATTATTATAFSFWGLWAAIWPIGAAILAVVAVIGVLVGAYNMLANAYENTLKEQFTTFQGTLAKSEAAVTKYTKSITKLREEYALYQKLGSLNPVEFKKLERSDSELNRMSPEQFRKDQKEMDQLIEDNLRTAKKAKDGMAWWFQNTNNGKVRLADAVVNPDDIGRVEFPKVDWGKYARAERHMFEEKDGKILAPANDGELFWDDNTAKEADFSNLKGVALEAATAGKAMAVLKQKMKETYLDFQELDAAYAGGDRGIFDLIGKKEAEVAALETELEIASQNKTEIDKTGDKEAKDRASEVVKVKTEQLARQKSILDAAKAEVKTNEKTRGLARDVVALNRKLWESKQAVLTVEQQIAAEKQRLGRDLTALEVTQINKNEADRLEHVEELNKEYERTKGLLDAQIELEAKLRFDAEKRAEAAKKIAEYEKSLDDKEEEDKSTDREKVTLERKRKAEELFGTTDLQTEIDKIAGKYGLKLGLSLEELSDADKKYLGELNDVEGFGAYDTQALQDINKRKVMEDRLAKNRAQLESRQNRVPELASKLPEAQRIADETRVAANAAKEATIADSSNEQKLRFYQMLEAENVKAKTELEKLQKEYDRAIIDAAQMVEDINASVTGLGDLDKASADREKKKRESKARELAQQALLDAAYQKEIDSKIEDSRLDREIAKAKRLGLDDRIARLERIKTLRAETNAAEDIFGENLDAKDKAAMDAEIAAEMAESDAKAARDKIKRDRENQKDILKNQLREAKATKNKVREAQLEEQIKDLELEDAADDKHGSEAEIKKDLANDKNLMNRRLKARKDFIAEEKRLYKLEAKQDKDKKDKKSIVDELEKRRTEAQKDRLNTEKSITDALLKQASSARDIVRVYQFLMAIETQRYFASERARKKTLKDEQNLRKALANGASQSRISRLASNLGASEGRYKQLGGFNAAVSTQTDLLKQVQNGMSAAGMPKPPTIAEQVSGVISGFFNSFAGFNAPQNLPAGKNPPNSAGVVNNTTKTVTVQPGAIVINNTGDTDNLLEVIQESISDMFGKALG